MPPAPECLEPPIPSVRVAAHPCCVCLWGRPFCGKASPLLCNHTHDFLLLLRCPALHPPFFFSPTQTTHVTSPCDDIRRPILSLGRVCEATKQETTSDVSVRELLRRGFHPSAMARENNHHTLLLRASFPTRGETTKIHPVSRCAGCLALPLSSFGCRDLRETRDPTTDC